MTVELKDFIVFPKMDAEVPVFLCLKPNKQRSPDTDVARMQRSEIRD